MACTCKQTEPAQSPLEKRILAGSTPWLRGMRTVIDQELKRREFAPGTRVRNVTATRAFTGTVVVRPVGLAEGGRDPGCRLIYVHRDDTHEIAASYEHNLVVID